MKTVRSELVSKAGNSLLAGNLQGISPIWPSEAGPDGQNRPALSAAYGTIPYALRAGNFSEPCKELNRAIREIFVLIREFRGSGIAVVTVGGVRPSRSLASHP